MAHVPVGHRAPVAIARFQVRVEIGLVVRWSVDEVALGVRVRTHHASVPGGLISVTIRAELDAQHRDFHDERVGLPAAALQGRTALELTAFEHGNGLAERERGVPGAGRRFDFGAGSGSAKRRRRRRIGLLHAKHAGERRIGRGERAGEPCDEHEE